jgi:hypothetical protein
LKRALTFVAACLITASAFAGARITIRSIDAENAGLNDPAPAQPAGDNNGTTLGQQRIIALQHAADIWGRLLDSSVEIVIEARMRSLTCEASTAVLAQAGPKNVLQNFDNAPAQDVWYPIALANKFARRDLIPDAADISAAFNADIDNSTCLGNTSWYYGLDGRKGSNIDLVTVALHEFAHGLGFSGTYNSITGALFQGKPNVFELHTLDNTAGLRWDQMTDAQRLTSQTNDQNLVWDGSSSRFAASKLLGPTPFLSISAPAAVAGTYAVGTATFGGSVTIAGLAGNIVAAADDANETGPTTTDGCSTFTNAAVVIGRMALVDRGTCRFVVKAKNAQDAGAIALVIVDNSVAASPPTMGGDDSSITIPVVSVTKATGDALRALLADGISALIGADPQRLAGADTGGFVKLFAPANFSGGSSVHHWDTSARPNLLMEPNIASDLTHSVDITTNQLIDMGWTEPTGGRRTPRRAQ